MAELGDLIASRAFVTTMLTAIGVAIAFGPEIRLAMTRIRRADANDEDLPPVRAH